MYITYIVRTMHIQCAMHCLLRVQCTTDLLAKTVVNFMFFGHVCSIEKSKYDLRIVLKNFLRFYFYIFSSMQDVLCTMYINTLEIV